MQIQDYKISDMTTKDILEMLGESANDKANEASRKMHLNKDNPTAREFHYGQYMAFCTMYSMIQVQLSHLESRENLPSISEEMLRYPLTSDECFKEKDNEK